MIKYIIDSTQIIRVHVNHGQQYMLMLSNSKMHTIKKKKHKKKQHWNYWKKKSDIVVRKNVWTNDFIKFICELRIIICKLNT